MTTDDSRELRQAAQDLDRIAEALTEQGERLDDADGQLARALAAWVQGIAARLRRVRGEPEEPDA
jgi:phage-related minor tail protein